MASCLRKYPVKLKTIKIQRRIYGFIYELQEYFETIIIDFYLFLWSAFRKLLRQIDISHLVANNIQNEFFL